MRSNYQDLKSMKSDRIGTADIIATEDDLEEPEDRDSLLLLRPKNSVLHQSNNSLMPPVQKKADLIYQIMPIPLQDPSTRLKVSTT